MSTDKKKITEYLRLRDLCLKKIEKESGRIVAYETVSGNSKPSTELVNTSATFQSVHDLLTNACVITSELRRANVATQTSMTDYFGNVMSVVDCRQNMVSDKLVGLPSVYYHLVSLYNKMLKQSHEVNIAVKNHNDSHALKLKKIHEIEYNKHEEERKSSRDQNVDLPVDFETAYEAKLKNISDAFWLKNKATHVDPLGVFDLLTSISDWTDKFEKEKEMQLNRANNSEAVFNVDLTQYEGEPSVSLEELSNLIKDKNSEILTLINRLVIVSWKVGNTEPINILVTSAKDNYELLMNMLKSYGLMQNAYRVVSTFVPTQFTNSLTKTRMSAVDVVDLKNIVIPIMTKMVDLVEKQKQTTTSQVKSQESSIRSEIVKLLETSMSSASSRPTADKIKEYTNNLIESVSSKVLVAPDIERHIATYQQFLDEFDSQIRPALATVNANTRVKIVWDLNNIPKVRGSWDTINQIIPYAQPEIVESASLYNNLEDLTISPPVNFNSNTVSQQRFGGGRGRGNVRNSRKY